MYSIIIYLHAGLPINPDLEQTTESGRGACSMLFKRNVNRCWRKRMKIPAESTSIRKRIVALGIRALIRTNNSFEVLFSRRKGISEENANRGYDFPNATVCSFQSLREMQILTRV